MRSLAIALVAFGIVASCHTPPPDPVDWPCGYQGVSCGDNTCCPRFYECGATGTSCPADMCCYVGDDWPKGAKREPKRQVKKQ